jgi:hypothetical protein
MFVALDGAPALAALTAARVIVEACLEGRVHLLVELREGIVLLANAFTVGLTAAGFSRGDLCARHEAW